MDLNYSKAELAFQEEVRGFFSEHLPDHISRASKRGGELSPELYEEWRAILFEKGWVAPMWPKEYGGQGWNPVQRHIYDVEARRFGAPTVMALGVNLLGPALIGYGTKEQKAEILPRILSGEDVWCQGFSEPGSGSDLASLRTRAMRDGDHYIVNGQKTWTTLGHHANKVFNLVRTDPDAKNQEGISFLLTDLDTPGVEMRPIRLIEGGHEVNEVFFTDVRVPVSNLVGSENKGWDVAKYLLVHERTGIAGVGDAISALDTVKHLGATVRRSGKPLAEDPHFAGRVALLEADLEAMKITNLRMLYRAQTQGAPGPETSMLKIKGSEIRQGLNDLARRALGPAAAPSPADYLNGNFSIAPEGHDHVAATYFNNRKISIYGGSNEIQRNILTKAALEL